MTTLVTGGGGFLGQFIVEQLLAQGEAVRVLCRNDYPQLREQGVEIVRGDLRDPARVLQACRGVQTVHHTAAIAGIWGRWKDYYEINTLGTQSILDACLQAGIERLIYTSSPSVVFDGRPHLDATESLPYPRRYLCSYPKSKMLAEKKVLAANQPGKFLTVALRPHLIWGPRDNHLIPRLIQRAKQGKLIRVGDGLNLISTTYVENAAVAQIQAAKRLVPGAPHCGKAYFINDPAPVNLWGWIGELLELSGLPPIRRSISARNAFTAGLILEGIHGLLRFNSEPRMTRFLAQQLSQSHTYSIAHAQQDFGYTPAVSHHEGMQRLIPDLKRWGLQSS